ncbi:MAG: hypothetical protein ABII88_01330 [Candidatus Omnitrophota bacterium]
MKVVNLNKLITIGMISVFFISFLQTAVFAEKKDRKNPEPLRTNSTINEVVGEVASFDGEIIVITYGDPAQTGESFDMSISIEPENLELNHIKSLDQIKKWNTVRISYEVITEEYAEEKVKTRNVARAISFIKAGKPPVYEPEQDE